MLALWQNGDLMSKTKVVKNSAQNPEQPKKKNVLLIVIAVMVSIALAVGIVLGVVNFILSRKAVVEYKGVRINEKEAAYLVSVYKTEYMASLNSRGIAAKDTSEFWETQNPDGSGTFGEGFTRAADSYLKAIAVGVYLYDQNAELDKVTKQSIETKAASVAEYLYNTEGFEALFEADAAKMGYDYEAYLNAAVMLYKYSISCSVVYGDSGEGAAYLPQKCIEYLNACYSHVRLVFIRTESTFETDDEGNRVEESGEYKLKAIESSEKEERVQEIESIKKLISDYNSGNASIDSQYISDLLQKYKAEQAASRIEKGYYFSPYSEYTASFTEDESMSRVVDMAYSMNIDSSQNAFSWCEVSVSGINGKKETAFCLIYKSPCVASAYADSDLSEFFTDFYKDAAALYIHPQDIAARSAEIETKDKFYDMQVVGIPYNKIHIIRDFSGS